MSHRIRFLSLGSVVVHFSGFGGIAVRKCGGFGGSVSGLSFGGALARVVFSRRYGF